MKFEPAKLKTPPTIIKAEAIVVGGGAAGCLAAIKLAQSGYQVIVVEKADIRRSGCLAAGVNALNAYIGRGKVPQDYVDYALADAHGIARRDLLLSIAERLNEQAAWLESAGLPILKDQDGRYAERSWRNVKINGENIKPLMAAAVAKTQGLNVLNRCRATHLLSDGVTVYGVAAFSPENNLFYHLQAPATIIATGGAAGLYRPNNHGSAPNRIWYCPFNTGAGLAMGIRAGAEMTTLEMRLVALRCRDTLAPTGTLALGAGARQVNALGRPFEGDYGRTTSQRVLAWRRETEAGRGPCRLAAEISADRREELYRAYLNMCPSQTLKWLEQAGPEPRPESGIFAEVEGSEPYVQGGHVGGGFWIDTNRQTTLTGLWAVGDAAGGAPQKYVTGSMAEGVIAAEDAAQYLQDFGRPAVSQTDQGRPQQLFQEALTDLTAQLKPDQALAPGRPRLQARDLGLALEKTMDLYAGGISAGYRYSSSELVMAATMVAELANLADKLSASSLFELSEIWELKERLTVARSLIAHLESRKETRWPGFGEYSDYPQIDPEFECFVNSRLEDNELKVFRRPMTRNNTYEHHR
ncbi:MAG: adenylyl-sulfate reductase subunit alpha [Deltaproteobacteria bacterium]|nr:adenylyl-sulfate reductase subunit alpha [Deltaproteobacteria bacterium]